MTSLRERFTADMKEAMKAGEKAKVAAIRLISAALKDKDIEARGAGKGEATADEILGVLQKMIKQRRESFAIYEKAGRTEQAKQEATEIAVIEEFLPKQMSEAEAREAIAAAIKESGASSPKEMGKVMGLLKTRFAGQMDFGKASGLVKELLK